MRVKRSNRYSVRTVLDAGTMGSATEKLEATDGNPGSGSRRGVAVSEIERNIDKLRVNKERARQRLLHWVRPW